MANLNEYDGPTTAAESRQAAKVPHPIPLGAPTDPYGLEEADAIGGQHTSGPRFQVHRGANPSPSLLTATEQVNQAHAQLMMELAAELPLGIGGAMSSCHAALLRWRGLSSEARAAATAYYGHEMKSSSVRIQCTTDLQQDEYVGEQLVRKALSYSAADKAASDHPRYQAHKQQAHLLATAYKAAEDAAAQALETLHCQQLYLAALTKLEQLGEV
jgi:hypothetical protein